MDIVTVPSGIVGAVVTGESWENALLRVAASFNAKFSSVPHVSSLVVEEEYRLVDCLRRHVCGESPVIVNHVDYAAVLDVTLKSSRKVFVGFKPIVLDHLQWPS